MKTKLTLVFVSATEKAKERLRLFSISLISLGNTPI